MLIANFEVKLNERVDMTFVWFESQNPFQVYPDAFEFDFSGGHFSDLVLELNSGFVMGFYFYNSRGINV